jgi:hypothetical protein
VEELVLREHPRMRAAVGEVDVDEREPDAVASTRLG